MMATNNSTGRAAAEWFAEQSFHPIAEAAAVERSRARDAASREYERELSELDQLIAEAEARPWSGEFPLDSPDDMDDRAVAILVSNMNRGRGEP
jgi:hypothetical protein